MEKICHVEKFQISMHDSRDYALLRGDKLSHEWFMWRKITNMVYSVSIIIS